MTQEVAGANAPLAVKEYEEKSRKAERRTLLIVIGAVVCLFILALLIPTGVVEDAANLVSYYEQGGEVSRNVAQNCKDPRNAKMAYCREKQAQADSDWKSISRFSGGKTNQFTLHRK